MNLIIAGIVIMLVALALGASVGLNLKVSIFDFSFSDRPRLRTGTWVLIGLSFLPSIGLIGTGTLIEYRESETNLEIARQLATQGLGASRGSIETLLVEPTPTLARVAMPTIVPGTPVLSETGPDPEALFSSAYAADLAGRNDEAIGLYEEAIEAGLRGDKLVLAHVEIGFLEILELAASADGSERDGRCDSARSHFAAARDLSESPLVDELARAIEEACG